MSINCHRELGILKRISQKDIASLMERLDTLLEERQKEKYQYKKTAAAN